MKWTLTLLLVCLSVVQVRAQTWIPIATDASGDSPGGLDGTALHYWYDPMTDVVHFRITVTNLASYSTGPAADFSFGLPYGMDGGYATGTHWTTPGTPVHKIASVYADLGGSPPYDYTFTSYANNVVVASNASIVLCASDCFPPFIDVANNHMRYSTMRTNIITNAEMNGNANATITVVCNVGHDLGWDDNISATGTMTLNLSTGLSELPRDTDLTIGPNPCRDQLVVTLGMAAGQVDGIELTDLTGRSVRRERIALPVTTLDVSGLVAGTYLVTITFADRAPITRKVRIE